MQNIFDRIPLFNRLDHHMREVVQGASVTLGLKVLGTGLTFGFTILLARTLGAEGAGVYYLALTVTSIATVVGRMGLDNALLRFVAAKSSVGEWGKVGGLYSKGVLLAGVASVVSSVVMFALAPFIASTLFSKPELTVPLYIMSLAVVPMVMVFLHAEMLKGLKLIRDSQVVRLVGVPGISLLVFYLLGEAWGVKGAVFAYVAAAASMAIVGMWLWRRATPVLRKTVGSFDTNKLLRSSMPLFSMSIMQLVIGMSSTFILGIWGTRADVGIFSIALRTASLTGFILLAVNSIVAPKFAALYQQGDMEALGYTARTSARLMRYAALPLLLIFLFCPEIVLGFFGREFVEGALILTILAVGQFINVALGSVGYLLLMTGHEKVMRNISVLVAIICVVTNLIMVPYFGIVGAAVATFLSIVIMNLIACYMVFRTTMINMLPWPLFSMQVK